MSLRHRRTTENSDINSSKPARLSRIAQPIKRPSMREPSLDRNQYLDVPGSYSYPSQSKRGATPVRTPNQPIRTRQSVILTSGKEKINGDDKKWIQLQATKIQDYLRSVDIGLGDDFTSKGGLKKMSTKQFLIIIEHFLKVIAGNRLLVGTNYVESIPKILVELQYPYTINKSWLKTPSAPHAYSNLILLLGWLLSFAVGNESFKSLEDDNLVPCKSFPDQSFIRLFLRKIEEGFSLWNNRKETDFDCLKQELVNDLIYKHTGLKKENDIDDKIQKLNKELDSIMQSKVVVAKEKDFNKLDKDIKIKRKTVKRLQDSTAENEEQLKRLSQLIEGNEAIIQEIQPRIDKISNIVCKQTVSIKERDEIMVNINLMKKVLQSKEQSVYELQDMGSKNQVICTRLKAKSVDAVNKFKNYLYKIFSQCENSEYLDIQSLFINQNPLDLGQQINRYICFLKEISLDNSNKYQEYFDLLNEKENQCKVLNFKNDALKEKLDSLTKKYIELENNVRDQDINFLKADNVITKQKEEFHEVLKELTNNINTIQTEIPLKRNDLQHLQSENVKIKERIFSKADEILDQKESNIKALDNAATSLQNTLKEINMQLKDIL